MEQGDPPFIKFWHVIPEDDTQQHELTPMCDCMPKAHKDNYYICVHNAFDGRDVLKLVYDILK